MGRTRSEARPRMRGCWYYGPDLVRLEPREIVYLRGIWGSVSALFRVLGAEYLAEHGYLEEVWDPEAEAAGKAAPWPVVDILDDGRVVARRVALGVTEADADSRP